LAVNEPHDSAFAVVAKTLTVILAWFGTIKLVEVQQLVAIVSGLIVGGYAATQWFVLWRDKIRGK
jgi:predicted membrane protein